MSRSPSRFRYRLLAFAMLLAVVTGVGWSTGYLETGRWTDVARLRDEADPMVRRVLTAVRSFPTGVVEGVIFLSGLVLGWASGIRVVGRHLRQRPLLMADLRSADMPLAEGVRHVLLNASPPVADNDAAVALLLREAASGRLTLWRRRHAGALGRVSPLAVRTALARIKLISSVARWSVTHGIGFVLLSTEVERLWPRRYGQPSAPGRTITTN